MSCWLVIVTVGLQIKSSSAQVIVFGSRASNFPPVPIQNSHDYKLAPVVTFCK